MQKISEGRTAEVYDFDSHHVLKLYKNDVQREVIEYEFRTNQLVSHLDIKSPRAKHLSEHSNRTGIVFEKIKGTTLLQAMVETDYNIQKLAYLFAELHIQLHQKEIELDAIEQYHMRFQKENLKDNILHAHLLTTEQKETIVARLALLEDGSRLCHGDYHPDNILLGEDNWIIDWMTGNIGNPLGDVARTIVIIRYGTIPIEIPPSVHEYINQQREILLQNYLTRYLSLSGYNINQFEQWMLPIAAARLIEPIPEEEKKTLLSFILSQLG